MLPATAAPNLAQRLKTATASMHRRVERTAFVSGMLRGDLDRPGYVALLRNLHALYAALEPALERHSARPDVGPVVLPALFRRDAIAADLTRLNATPEVDAAPLLQATRRYVERLHELDAASPHLLVAHAYTRYLGDLNGGQMLRRIVVRTLGLEGDGGTMFYDFGTDASQRALAKRFRSGLAVIEADVPDIDGVVNEAVGAFQRHEQLFAELAA